MEGITSLLPIPLHLAMSDLVSEMYQQQIDSLQSSLYALEDELGKYKNYVVQCKRTIRNLANNVQLSDNSDMEPIDIDQLKRSQASYGLNDLKQRQDQAHEQQNIQHIHLQQLSANLEILDQKLQEYKLFNKSNNQRVEHLISGIQAGVKGAQVVQKHSSNDFLVHQQQTQGYLEKIFNQEQAIAQNMSRISDLEAENAKLSAQAEQSRLALQRTESLLQNQQDREQQLEQQLRQCQQMLVKAQTEKLQSNQDILNNIEVIDDDTIWYYKNAIQKLTQENEQQKQLQNEIYETLMKKAQDLERIKNYYLNQLQDLRKDFQVHTQGYYKMRYIVEMKYDELEKSVEKLKKVFEELLAQKSSDAVDLQRQQTSYYEYAKELQEIVQNLHMVSMTFIINGGLAPKHLRRLIKLYEKDSGHNEESFGKKEGSSSNVNQSAINDDFNDINDKVAQNAGSTWLQRRIKEFDEDRLNSCGIAARDIEDKAKQQELKIDELKMEINKVNSQANIFKAEMQNLKLVYEQKFADFKNYALKVIGNLLNQLNPGELI